LKKYLSEDRNLSMVEELNKILINQ
jgi:hypothetical protein